MALGPWSEPLSTVRSAIRILLSSDHLSFRLRGLVNSVTLTLLPASQLHVMGKMVSDLRIMSLLMGRRPRLPEPLSRVHTPLDTSAQLNEASLQTMLRVLLEILDNQEATTIKPKGWGACTRQTPFRGN
jgi:hypothetical protein